MKTSTQKEAPWASLPAGNCPAPRRSVKMLPVILTVILILRSGDKWHQAEADEQGD